MKADDILVCSWGYDRTNVDYYRVVRVTATTAFLQMVASRVVRQTTGAEYVVPDLTSEGCGPVFGKKMKITSDGREYCRLSSFETAWLWDGKERYKTETGYGH
jgi:hypothetical protein